MKVSPLFAGIALFAAACTAGPVERQAAPPSVPEIAPGYLAGYLKQEELPNSLTLVPPPPAPGTAAFARDEEVAAAAVSRQGSSRWNQAVTDADLMFPKAASTFSCALGIEVSQAATPRLYLLLRRTLTDAGLSTFPTKKLYQRARPFMKSGAPQCTPREDADLRADGSYPSGHTAIGWAWALILAEAAPERSDAILARGRAFGDSRIACNVHWQSDVDEGRIMGSATVAKLQTNAQFQDDLRAAKAEIAAAFAAGSKPAQLCRPPE